MKRPAKLGTNFCNVGSKDWYFEMLWTFIPPARSITCAVEKSRRAEEQLSKMFQNAVVAH